ncbi:hypothetical protein EPN29_10165 [bacterium]|nr:MAG: hypothetical protein EPN29_10165 [bacterium]
MHCPRLRSLLLAAVTVFGFSMLGDVSVYAYSGNGAASWADGHWNADAPGWPTFSDDCTNYVSQALYLGGGYPQTANNGSPTDDSYWYMNLGSQTWTYSWTVAFDQERFQAIHYPGGYYWGTYSGTYGGNDTIYAGDELFYDWNSDGRVDHMSIQVSYGTDPNSGWYGDLVDQHTTNRYHAYWTLQPYNANSSTTSIDEYHISSSN